MTPSPIRAVAALALLGVLGLAGCGGSDDKDGGDSDFAKQSGDKIAADAKADMKDLDAVKFSGEITSSGGTTTLDVQASSAGDCTGSIGVGGGTAEILAKDGTNWFKPDEAFWRANAGDSADAIMSAVGDKWVLDTDSNFAQFCDIDAFFDNLFKDEQGAGKYQTTGTDEIDGQQVIKVEQSDDNGTSVGYVLIDGDHYLLKLERTEGDEPGHLEFSDFNEEFDVTAPADDEVIDLSTVQ
jgi:hypothetical protein